ncbi:MAG: tetratricopeptide repeat protein [Anaerolineaceae bacterium]|nr:tetratricopeptide repeat protein [Anaerolineaceae bacterium]
MQFLKNFRSKTTVENQKPVDNQAETFDLTWAKTLHLFQIISGVGEISFRLTHPKTGKPLKPHEGLNATFAEWKQIQSRWDQERYLFSFMLSGLGKSMNAWQVANILTAARQPDKALQLLQENPQPITDTKDYVPHCCSFANAYVGLQEANLALEWARKAFNAAPTNSSIRALYADALRLTGECEEPEEIYAELIKSARLTGQDDNEQITTMFLRLLARDTGKIASPVLAIQLADMMIDKTQADEFWKLGEAEFYASPYFRMHHAYHMLNSGQTERALAKLVALVQEMPWLREASLNLDILLKQIDPSAKKFMPEFQNQLRQRISEKGWTTEGMHPLQVDVKGIGTQTTSVPP